MVKRPPKSALSGRTGKRIFETASVEEQAEEYDFVQPGGSLGAEMLGIRNPGLLALRNKAEASRPVTALTSPRGRAELVSPRPVSYLLSNRPGTAVKEGVRKRWGTGNQENAVEKHSIAFTEDPIAYFSKRKDGRGHRFIYLNHLGDRTTDPEFNPYELTKVPFSEVRSEYFTMSANGVTHIMSDGNTEHIQLDRWAGEVALFSTIRRLKTFRLVFFWKPFRIWRNFVMRERYYQITRSVVTRPFSQPIHFLKG
jgi:hypothetical protein